MDRNHPWRRARSQFWAWGGHHFFLKSERKLRKGHGRIEALPSTNSLTLGFGFMLDYFLLVSHCYRLQLCASLKSTQTWKCPTYLSLGPQTASTGAGPGKLGWAISEVMWLWFSLLSASAVCGWYWWGNRFPVIRGGGNTRWRLKAWLLEEKGFCCFQEAKTNDLSEGEKKKFPLHVIYGKPFQVQSCLFRLQTKRAIR